jgi:hypothetical protein
MGPVASEATEVKVIDDSLNLRLRMSDTPKTRRFPVIDIAGVKT